MKKNESDIVIDNSQIFTTKKLYNTTYYNQLLEIMKVALSFIIASFALRIFDIIIFNYFEKNKTLYLFLLIVILGSIIIIGTKLFTYLKITNDKDDLLKKLI